MTFRTKAELDALEARRNALSAAELLRLDARRYRWLRDDNAYAPEEAMIRGGVELDLLCDAGIDTDQDGKYCRSSEG